MNIYTWFAKWNEEYIDHPNNFIPKYSYEDLCWTIFGLVGLCQKYLRTDGSRMLDQKRHGSDCCEHHFANCVNNNPNASLSDFRSYSARSTGIRANMFHSRVKTNTAGDTDICGRELMQPLSKSTTKRGTDTSFKIHRPKRS